MASAVVIETGRLLLVGPSPEQAAALRDYMARNGEHFGPFLPALPEGLDTLEFWHERLHAWREDVGAQMPLPNPAYDPSRPEHTAPPPKTKKK